MFEFGTSVTSTGSNKPATLGRRDDLGTGDYVVVGMTPKTFTPTNGDPITFMTLVVCSVTAAGTLGSVASLCGVRALATDAIVLDVNDKQHSNSGELRAALATLFDGRRNLDEVTLAAVQMLSSVNGGNIDCHEIHIEADLFRKRDKNGREFTSYKYKLTRPGRTRSFAKTDVQKICEAAGLQVVYLADATFA